MCGRVSVVLLVVVAAGFSTGQLMLLGGCPSQQVVQDFNSSQYLGKWYEIEKYLPFFELGGKCITAQYSDRGDGTFGIVNKDIDILTNQPRIKTGKAKFVGNTNEAKLTVSFDHLPSFIKSNYWVLDTDYVNYSIVWSCNDAVILHSQFLWILTREQKPPSTLIAQLKQTLRDRKLGVFFLQPTDQNNCP